GLTASTTYEWQVAHVDTGNNQTATSSYTATVTFTTAAMKADESTSDQEALTIYPNPASKELTVNFSNGVEGKVMIRLYDVSGKLMLAMETSAIAGMNQQKLDLNLFPAGLYTLQITMADGSIKNQKVIKVQE